MKVLLEMLWDWLLHLGLFAVLDGGCACKVMGRVNGSAARVNECC